MSSECQIVSEKDNFMCVPSDFVCVEADFVCVQGAKCQLLTVPDRLCVISEGVGLVKWGLAGGESDFEARRVWDRRGAGRDGRRVVCLTRCGLSAASPGLLGCRSSLRPVGCEAWCVSASGQVDAIKRTTSPWRGVMTQPRSQPARDLGFMRLARGIGCCRRAARRR